MNPRPTRVPSPSATQSRYAEPEETTSFLTEEQHSHVPATAAQRPQTAPPAVRDESQPALPTTGFAKLAAAIADVMAEIKPVDKSGWNDFHKYSYARMQDLSAELTPLMGKHGIVIFQNELNRDMFDDGRAMAVRYQFTIVHKTGEVWPERPVITGVSMCRTSNGKYDDKAFNKCHTSARKYFLLSLFQIPTDDAEDADSGGQQENGGGGRPQGKRPVPSPSGKMQPHLVPIIDQETPQAWATRFGAFIAKAETAAEIDQWYNLNANAFDKLKGRFQQVYNDAVDFMDACAAKLNKPKADSISSGPAADFPGDKPLKPDGLDIPPALDRRKPKVELTDLERDWLLGLGGAFSGEESLEGIAEQQDRLMAPYKGQVSDAAWGQAAELMNEHIQRVNEGG